MPVLLLSGSLVLTIYDIILSLKVFTFPHPMTINELFKCNKLKCTLFLRPGNVMIHIWQKFKYVIKCKVIHHFIFTLHGHLLCFEIINCDFDPILPMTFKSSASRWGMENRIMGIRCWKQLPVQFMSHNLSIVRNSGKEPTGRTGWQDDCSNEINTQFECWKNIWCINCVRFGLRLKLCCSTICKE